MGKRNKIFSSPIFFLGGIIHEEGIGPNRIRRSHDGTPHKCGDNPISKETITEDGY
jgi:hypothetical protein